MTRAWLVTLFGAAAGLACGETTEVPLSQVNLNRPIDVAFACYETSAATTQPAQRCEDASPQVTPDPALVAVPGLDWYGFILQSTSGTVAIARWPSKPADQLVSGVPGDVVVLDADPLTPGKNAISVGEDPIGIVTDKTGCYEVTANAGSCDLSVLDINLAVSRVLGTAGPEASLSKAVRRMDVTNAAGKIRARPAAIVVEPNTTVLGNACAKDPGGMAYIAYPGCNLVAGVDLATGKVTAGIRYDALGVPTVLTGAALDNLACPNECDGVPPTSGTRPVALDLEVAPVLPVVPSDPPVPPVLTSRLAIGADNAAAITVVDLDPATSLPAATAPLQIALEAPAGALGVTAVALSPQIAMGNGANNGDLLQHRSNNDNLVEPPPGGYGQYVYAVATDGTVRVADVLNVDKECDTQVDSRLVRALAGNLPLLQCFPVGDAATPARRAGARGPGIELPVAGVPTSVAIFKGRTKPIVVPDSMMMIKPVAAAASMLIGHFAVITAASGQTFVVNVDNDDGDGIDTFDPARPQATAPVLVMAHQLRENWGDRGGTAAAGSKCDASDPTTTNSGGPRSSAAPVARVPADTLPASRAGGLPVLRQFECNQAATETVAAVRKPISELQLGIDDLGVRDRVFPDLRSTIAEGWFLTWEGTLSLDGSTSALDGPPIRSAQMTVDSSGMRLVDRSGPYCSMGVEPFDVVQFRGCNAANGNADCPSGYTCYVHKDSKVPGLGACMLTDEAPRLADACADFLTTARRYTVRRAESGTLELHPRTHVLSTTPVDGCTDDDQCEAAANYAAQLRLDDQPGRLASVVDPHTWACEADPLRAPISTGKRCVQKCTTSADCDVGTICAGATAGGGPNGTCMEGVLPPQSCVNGPQRFEVRASEAFTVIGSRSGYVHPIIERGGAGPDARQCIRNPAASPLQLGRIPLAVAACDPAADPITGRLPAGGFEANPCVQTVSQFEAQPNYDPAQPGACFVPPAPAEQTVLTARDAPAIKFRNAALTLTLVDPYSPGDLVCHRDRLGAFGKTPMLIQAPFDKSFAPGYQLQFDVKAGFNPLTLASEPVAFPSRVVRGPSESLWVIDSGDIQATQAGQITTRGQIYRIESADLARINLLR